MLLNPNRGIHTFLCITTQSYRGLAWGMNAAMGRGSFQSKLVEQILVTWHKDTSPDKQTTVTEVIHYTEADLTIGTEAYTSSFPLCVSQAAVCVQRQVEMTLWAACETKDVAALIIQRQVCPSCSRVYLQSTSSGGLAEIHTISQYENEISGTIPRACSNNLCHFKGVKFFWGKKFYLCISSRSYMHPESPVIENTSCDMSN